MIATLDVLRIRGLSFTSTPQFVGFDSPKIEKESASICLFHPFKVEGTPPKVVV